MVLEAMTSSVENWYHLRLESEEREEPAPKAERPRARRKIWSMCWSAAVVTGDVADEGSSSTERDVAGEGSGMGIWVARNM